MKSQFHRKGIELELASQDKIKIQTDRQTVNPHQEKGSRIQQKVKKSFFI